MISFKNLFTKKAEQTFYSTSEAVSAGHPDRLADTIAASIIQLIQETDGVNSHAAIEVFLTHDKVIISGEATTTLDFKGKDAPKLYDRVEQVFNASGYTANTHHHWSTDEVHTYSDIEVVNNIQAQSPDISRGTTDKGADSGWNDQCVCFSSSEGTNSKMLGTAHYIATYLCDRLTEKSRETQCGVFSDGINFVIGSDIKTCITVLVGADGYTPKCVTAVTIAVPHKAEEDIEVVRRGIKNFAIKVIRTMGIGLASNCVWTINGTGRYVSHGIFADTSMTGRKISVNHPSAGPVWCNKMIGGGSLVKPFHASDLMLNIASRYVANVIVRAGLSKYAVVGTSGAIGSKGLQSIFIKGDDRFEKKINKERVYSFMQYMMEWTPKGIATKFGFFNKDFNFANVVISNFFGHPEVQPWERYDLIDEDAIALREFINFKG